MTQILPLGSQSDDAIEALLDAAFGTDRRGRTAYLIRKEMKWLPELSYAALDDGGDLIGTLQSWPVALHSQDGTVRPLVMVGPVAVRPDQQKGGFGRAMMDAVVQDARRLACPPLMMIGDPEYYGRFWGFSAEGTAKWQAPGTVEARRLLALVVDGGTLPEVGMLGPRITQMV
ncbi:GNAT family N-acetyltransferase [Sphingobium sp. SCG-1]|uniref:GNAT family N-acetyltransferase n=1 Tax=Sphingobium sp. SCG-1 TaxID=2072936 RepID=UPI000CD67F19|nr:N-acetyltransferase [Sphingobium sp. SCG-1]AUW58088.1 GNAT family N-acetyltransferase [Sphingobium sp. SCG-1]